VSIATGMAKNLGRGIHCLFHFTAFSLRKFDRRQPVKQFRAGHTNFAADFNNPSTMSLDLHGFTPLNYAVNHGFAIIGQICCSYYHALKIAILPMLASELEATQAPDKTYRNEA